LNQTPKTKVVFQATQMLIAQRDALQQSRPAASLKGANRPRPVSFLLTLAIEKGGHAPAKAQVSPEAPDRRKSMGGFLVTSPTIDKQISRNLLLWMSPI
jgi:hypothetical protein